MVRVGALAAFALGAFGCSLVNAFSDVGIECATDAECDDSTPCSDDVCAADGLCDHTPVDRSAELVQVPYDCNALFCIDGRTEAVVDDADVPVKPCMDAACQAGALAETPKADGTSCTVGSAAGTCSGGECIVECDPASNATTCDDENPCTDDACDAVRAECVHEALDNVEAPGGVAGDCQAELCVQGTLQVLADDTDVPIDDSDCTQDLCEAGTPSNLPLAASTPCGANGELYCDGAGLCVGCVTADHCVDTDTNDCQVADCQQSMCVVVNAANGAGCSDGLYCNGNDTCNSGSCSSHAGDPCPGADGDSDCTETCKESSDNCSANDPNGSACSDGLFCTGADSCNSGNCSVHAGNTCPGPDNDNNCVESCNETTNNCNGYDGNGAACMAGFSTGQCTVIFGSCQQGASCSNAQCQQ